MEEKQTEEKKQFEIGKTYLYVPVMDEDGNKTTEIKELSTTSPEEFVSWVKITCPTVSVDVDSVITLERKLVFFNKVMNTLSALKLSIPDTDSTKLF